MHTTSVWEPQSYRTHTANPAQPWWAHSKDTSMLYQQQNLPNTQTCHCFSYHHAIKIVLSDRKHHPNNLGNENINIAECADKTNNNMSYSWWSFSCTSVSVIAVTLTYHLPASEGKHAGFKHDCHNENQLPLQHTLCFSWSISWGNRKWCSNWIFFNAEYVVFISFIFGIIVGASIAKVMWHQVISE